MCIKARMVGEGAGMVKERQNGHVGHCNPY